MTLPNLKQKISSHNTKILNKFNEKDTKKNEKKCNCRVECPANGECLSENVIYKAEVTEISTQNTQCYVGLTGDTFKTRYRNHVKSFKNSKYQNETCLSNFIWKLKNEKTDYDVKWKIIDRGSTYTPVTDRCNLCLKEKYYLLRFTNDYTINNRNEFGNSCRHYKKLLISNHKD